ncbi:MAG: polymerase [Gemmatimonadetes bacterium]|nr:polymerase [Gemmatimonadota bacterium]
MDTTPDGTRRILLADCDSYFVRCAMLADPEGAGRAELLIVGGKATGRGVVTSASYAARKYGVHAGMPSSQAMRLCPGAMLVPVPGEMVGRKHDEVRAVLDRFSPVVEAASVDEFYLDLTGTERLYGGEPLEDTARRMQAAVMDETGIAISVGASTQRMLAKMAASVNKPMGVFVVPPGREEEFMLRFELGDIPGVGPAFQESLRRRGARTVRDIAALDEDTLAAWLGDSRGRWLHAVAHGRDPSRVHERSPQKSVSTERTFPVDIDDDEELRARLLSLAGETGAALREDGHRGRTITVRVRDGDFTDRSRSRTVPQPVQSDRAIYGVALELLAELRARRRGGVRLLGVGVSRLSTGDADAPLTFFGPDESLESPRDRTLSEVSDRLRRRFGKGAIVPGRIAPTPPRKE